MLKTITRQCPICKRRYKANKTRLQFDRETTCSRKCSYIYRGKHLKQDLTGLQVERWTVLGRGIKQSSSGAWYWKCRCICGVEKEVFHSSLVRGLSRSCGCRGRPLRRKPWRQSKEYDIWQKMKQRCLLLTDHTFKYYGGRGIQICKRWLNFENFYKDMGRRPSKDYSIERINNNGHYTPKNCKWILRKEQGKNKNPYGSFTKVKPLY